jgi:hypothetical protein
LLSKSMQGEHSSVVPKLTDTRDGDTSHVMSLHCAQTTRALKLCTVHGENTKCAPCADDKIGKFNLSTLGHCSAGRFLRQKWPNVPVLALGGGGYTISNVARTWAYETVALLGYQDCDIPHYCPVVRPLALWHWHTSWHWRICCPKKADQKIIIFRTEVRCAPSYVRNSPSVILWRGAYSTWKCEAARDTSTPGQLMCAGCAVGEPLTAAAALILQQYLNSGGNDALSWQAVVRCS